MASGVVVAFYLDIGTRASMHRLAALDAGLSHIAYRRHMWQWPSAKHAREISQVTKSWFHLCNLHSRGQALSRTESWQLLAGALRNPISTLSQ